MEPESPKSRKIFTLGNAVLWTAGLLALAVIGYLLKTGSLPSFPGGVTFALFAATVLVTTLFALTDSDARFKNLERIEQLEERAEREPEKPRYAWDAARATLQADFERNLSQIRWIFFVAVIVMLVGFSIILWGVGISISRPDAIKTSQLAALSGIVTEFIGLSFMLIYRSTMTQANQFMDVLERINTVGMAVQILESIPSENPILKDSIRAELVRLLLSSNSIRRPTT
jgi:hypothetical protein